MRRHRHALHQHSLCFYHDPGRRARQLMANVRFSGGAKRFCLLQIAIVANQISPFPHTILVVQQAVS
jgi:hypothetical protein